MNESQGVSIYVVHQNKILTVRQAFIRVGILLAHIYEGPLTGVMGVIMHPCL